MMLQKWMLTGLLALPSIVAAQGGWHDQQGHPLPETSTSKSRGGLAVALLVTADKDWQAKWNTAPSTIPTFTVAHEVKPGGALFILTLLSNPKVDSTSGMTDVTCDFVVSKPDGSDSVREADIPCFKTHLPGPPTNVYLSTASMKYTRDPGDPPGIWQVNVTVKDHLRDVEIPLQTSFVVH